jgi:hypothetical protein
VLDDPAVETSVEGIGREASVDTQPRRATRSTRNGRADVNYSQKYRPMDEVTRPRRAARITGSRPPTSFADTSDEEEPELSSGESTDDDEPSEGSDTPATRMPDPRAVRHSSRAEAQKQVNYSKAHHPQDWAIKGFRHSAKRKRRSLSSNKSQKKSKKQATPASPIALSSDKTSESDSDDEDEDDEPANKHPPADAASPSRSQSEIPDAYRIGSDGIDAQSPKRNTPPQLPHGDTSSVSVDAIIQGSYIIHKGRSSQAAAEHSDPDGPNDGPEINFANASTREIGDAMSALMDGVATPNATNSNSTSSDNVTPDVPIVAQPPVTMPTALVTPASMVTPDKACTQVGCRFGIKRPYIATQPKSSTQPNPSNIDEDLLKPDQARTSSNDRCLQKLDQAKRFDQPSFKVSTALVDYSSSSDDDEEPTGRDMSPEALQYDHSSNASRQAMRDASEHAARTARAKEVASQLSSGILSQHHSTSKSSNAGTANVSRQVSRDTLPDDHSPSFFEEAMAGTQTRSQSDRDDDESRRLFDYRYSELPVSERERSDPLTSQEQPVSDGQRSHDVSDGADNHLPNDTTNSEQPRGSDQPLKQQSQSSTTLPKSTGTESQGDAAGQAAGLTYSEDSALLQSSSA